MKVSDFDFELPAERIALHPVEPRDSARMLQVRPGAVVLRATAGEAEEPLLLFQAGFAVAPFSLGRRGDWRVRAQGVVDVHLYLWFDGLISLYIISALFGLFQGGIVPSYAIIVREYFSPREAGTRLGLVLMATLLGMALGGWLSGLIFDLTGSYRAAFLNGLGWNVVNVSIMLWLLQRSRRRGQLAAA